MAKRQPYDAATPFYPEKVSEKGILDRLRGLGFGSMEREVAALIAERDKLREALGVMEWRPIETAPKDRTPVDLWVPHRNNSPILCRATDFAWVDGAWRNFDGVDVFRLFLGQPSHWMPPPKPPKGENI